MEAVYPAAGSARARGRRLRRAPGPHRYRTQPVTFAEIKEVDEECEELCERARAGSADVSGAGAGERRRVDLAQTFADLRPRRRRDAQRVIRELPDESAAAAPAPLLAAPADGPSPEQ